MIGRLHDLSFTRTGEQIISLTVREDFGERFDELKGFDRLLAGKPPYAEAVSALAKAEPHAVTTVTADQLALWRDMIVSLDYPYPAPMFLTETHIAMALARAVELYNT